MGEQTTELLSRGRSEGQTLLGPFFRVQSPSPLQASRLLVGLLPSNRAKAEAWPFSPVQFAYPSPSSEF